MLDLRSCLLAEMRYYSTVNVHVIKRQCGSCPSKEYTKYQGYGWDITGVDILQVVWFDCGIAPEQCLDLISCSCKKECIPGSCCCIDNSLPCTDMCRIDCENKVSSIINDELEEEE